MRLEVLATTASNYGKARIYLDDVYVGEADLYSSVTKYQQVVWDTGALQPGWHTLRLEWTGTKSAASRGTTIALDAFKVMGTVAQAAPRREQNAAGMTYTGTWTTVISTSHSGSSIAQVNTSGAALVTTFIGAGFVLVASTGTGFGIARVYVDGVETDLVDLYSASTLYQQAVLRKVLPYGTHTVRVEWTGTKYAKAKGTTINVDAIDVIAGAPAGSAPTQSLTFDAANRVVGYTYDARGNVLEDGTHLYTWDPMNRLTAVKLASTGALLASYGYDSDGMRQVATVGGVTTRFVVDAVSDEIVALLDSAGAVVSSFVRDAAGALVAMVRSGAVLTYLTNAHGDVTALVDAAGAVVARWTYDAWGNPTEYDGAGNQVAVGTAGNPFLYAGYLYDVATGLYYLRARYYDPGTGRFLSMDPEPGALTDRLSQNPYIYCQNDPVNLADPDGRAAVAGSGGGKKLTAWQQIQLAALRAKKAAEAAWKKAAAKLADAKKARADRLAAAKRALKKAAAAVDKKTGGALSKTAGVGKSLAFYAKNTVKKPKLGTADYTRYYSMQAKVWNTVAGVSDVAAEASRNVAIVCAGVFLVSAAIVAAPLVTAGAQAAGAWVAAHTAGVAASGTASAVGGATVRELTDGEFEDEKNIVQGVQQTARTVGQALGDPSDEVTAIQRYYSPNDGFAGTPQSVTLEQGGLIDRYGYNLGRYASPSGTPAYARSLPFGSEQLPLRTFEVVKPIEGVMAGEVAPWFNQPGMGTQYLLPSSVQTLIDSGYLLQR